MTPLERRYLRRAIREWRKFEWSWILRVALAVLVAAAAVVWLLMGSLHMPWYWAVPAATLFVLAAGVGPLREPLAKVGRSRRFLQSGLQDGTAQELRVHASAVIRLEEMKEQGSGFAFQTGEDEILFLQRLDFHPAAARFPSGDFGLVRLTGDPEDADVIVKYGRKIAPLRAIPAAFLEKLPSLPDDLDRATGTLDDLEAILTAWPRDKLA